MSDALDRSETDRDLGNLIQFGQIASVDAAAARAVVETEDGALTAPLAWITRAGSHLVSWSAPSVGEQVLILSPGAETASGVILAGIYCSAQPAPANRPDLHRLAFGDGAKLDYDEASGALLFDLTAVGAFEVKVGSSRIRVQAGQILIEADEVLLGPPGSPKGVARLGDQVSVTSGSSAGLWPLVEASAAVKAT